MLLLAGLTNVLTLSAGVTGQDISKNPTTGTSYIGMKTYKKYHIKKKRT